MKSIRRLGLLAALISIVPAAFAAEVNLNVFLGPSPLKGIDVQLDGTPVGATGSQGEVVMDADVGSHRITLLKLDAVLSEFQFELAAGQGADLSVSFKNFESAPEVEISPFQAGVAGTGDPGVVEGYITDHEGYALPGATIVIKQTGDTVVSNEDGYYRFSLPRGRYAMEVSHPEFKTARTSSIRVISNVGVAAMVSLKLRTPGDDVPPPADVGELSLDDLGIEGLEEEAAPTPSGSDGDAVIAGIPGESQAPSTDPVPAATVRAPDESVEEIVVVGTYRPTQTTADLEQFSIAIVDVISADDLIRFGDSDVAASLKRVVGVSVTGGKYAVVRGLDGRYISSTLNDGLLPSTDPFRRDVQLDLFPADILEQIDIQKAFTADLPGETTGGIIAMKTKDAAGEYINKLSLKLGYVTDTTFESLGSYKRGHHDWLGVDGGRRELPNSLRIATNKGQDSLRVCGPGVSTNCFPASAAGVLGNRLTNDWAPRSHDAPPDFGLTYAIGNQFDAHAGTWGAYATASYDQSWGSRQSATKNEFDLVGTYTRDTRNIGFNSYLALGYLDDDGWEIKSKTLYVRDTEDMVEQEDELRIDDNVNQNTVTLEWVERALLTQQFLGTVPVGQLLPFGTDEQAVNWRISAGQTYRYSPDRRSYLYQSSAAGTNQTLLFSSIERSFSTLVENSYEVGADYSLPVEFSSRIRTEFIAGAMINIKERDLELVRLGYSNNSSGTLDLTQPIEDILSPENISNDLVRVRGSSLETDTYDADQDNIAFYVSSITDIGEQWQFTFGLRQDNFEQEVNFPFQPVSNRNLVSDELLPGFTMLYRPTDQLQVRAGISRTVSRPNVTENSRSVFFDQRGDQFFGCSDPGCDASEIDNYDLRFEYYFADQDSVSLAVFYKDIAAPLERAVGDTSGSALGANEFRNADSAEVSGLEIDGSYTLLDNDRHLFRVNANVSLIDSEVTLDADGFRLEQVSERELQGQSPLLANLQVSWDYEPMLIKATLLGSYFDDRIDRVGRAPLGPIEEVGRINLGVNVEKELFDGSKISLKMKNLLDEPVELVQQGRVIERYKEGIEFSLGYSMSFD